MVPNTVKSFFVPKSTANVHVLSIKYHNQLLEMIDASQFWCGRWFIMVNTNVQRIKSQKRRQFLNTSS
ncbi:unnamed protein product [Lactuca virosa]|uniref:Uncharacterized protein n=1 Tax=Lactuca virosa TaxID=75947 RepID=A0AAU9NPY8_9ASTR|nr:unnamed protein product [Lactuca virosa]